MNASRATPVPTGPPTVTLYDVARRIGVSHVTVWRALRQSPKVSAAKRKEIQELAAEMGYRPNPAAANLARSRKSSRNRPIEAVLAWLNFWQDPKGMRRNFLFDKMWEGAVAGAEALGYRIEEFICDETLPPRTLKEVLRARGIQGALLPPQRPPVRCENYEFDWSEFAAIRLSHTVSHPKFNIVTFAQCANALDALSKMRQLGYQRIGFVTGHTIRAYGRFDAGYLKMQATWPKKDWIPLLELPDRKKNFSREPDVEKLSVWMRKHKPEAILSTEPPIRALLAAAHFRVPEDVKVASLSVGISDLDTGIYENAEEVGRVAAEHLITLVQRGRFGIPVFRQDILVRGIWQDGTSLPARE